MFDIFFNSLRPTAIVVGICLMYMSGKHLRDFTTSRLHHQYLFIAGILVILVSAVPALIRSTARLFGLSPAQNGGILLSLMLATGTLFLLLLQLLEKSEASKRKLDILNREFSLAHFYASDEYRKMPEPGARSALCIVPAYNEEESLVHLVSRFCAVPGFGRQLTVVIIDDGSDDGTRWVVQNSSCVYLRQMTNRGQGSALRTGYKLAVDLGYEYAVTIDADGQNNPEEISSLLQPLIDGQADVVIGSRILGQHDVTVIWRHWGVKFFTWMFNFLSGQKITDISSGFKAIRVSALKSLDLYEDQFQASEFLMLSAKTGARIREVPIHFRQRHSGKSKKGNELLYAAKFCVVLLFTWFRYK